jgi:hypothetical protein
MNRLLPVLVLASQLAYGLAVFSCYGLPNNDPNVCSGSHCEFVPYLYREKLFIENNFDTALPVKYAVNVIVDTAALITSGKLSPTCNDLRIFYYTGTSTVEVNRDIRNYFFGCNTNATKIWFPVQKDIPSLETDSDYYLLYGNTTNVSPPLRDLKEIYVLGERYHKINFRNFGLDKGLMKFNEPLLNCELAVTLRQQSNFDDDNRQFSFVLADKYSFGYSANISRHHPDEYNLQVHAIQGKYRSFVAQFNSTDYTRNEWFTITMSKINSRIRLTIYHQDKELVMFSTNQATNYIVNDRAIIGGDVTNIGTKN